MKRRGVRLIILAVLVALAVYGWRAGWFGSDDARQTIGGNVEVREVELAFRVGGRIASIAVDEGDTVKPGQLVARLDGAPFADAVASARAEIEVADAALTRQRNGNRPQEIAEAEAALRAAQAVAANADKEFARVSDLAAKGFVSAARVDATRAAKDSARAAIDEMRAKLSLLREGTRADAIAESAASRDAAQARQRRTATDMADTQLFAPSAGVVQTRVLEPGAIVGAGEPVLVLAITQPVRVRAYVPEPLLGKIKPGQQVAVVGSGGRRWPGRIGNISPTAEFTPRTVETESQRADLVYRIRIIVEDPKGELRQGQPITVDLGTKP
jgi:HlyD family secretion protein